MISDFQNTYKRLLQYTQFQHTRYLYADFQLTNRLTGLVGARGTGKTTLMLQFIKNNLTIDDCIYVSLDHIYFTQHDLLAFVQRLYDEYGTRYFFFDEAHKYPHWNQALKNLYDAYPDIYIVFSGSSSLDLVKGAYDLSRRGVIYRLGGMSFREYLLFQGIVELPAIDFDDLLQNRAMHEATIASTRKLLGHFKTYLGQGYYPFVLEDDAGYSQKIQRTIEKTIYEDIAGHYKLKTENLGYFRHILAYMASIPPSTLNTNKIAKHIGVDNKTVQHYLHILQETNLVALVSKNKAGSQLLKKTEKIYLDNADLYHSISQETGFEPALGTLREIFFINMIKNKDLAVHYSDIGDFEIKGKCFEIGGKGKTKKQIKKQIETSYVVKDDVLYGSRYDIPLYLFGFLY